MVHPSRPHFSPKRKRASALPAPHTQNRPHSLPALASAGNDRRRGLLGGHKARVGNAVWPVCTLADSTGTAADMARDLRRICPRATVGEPLALLGEKEADFGPQLAVHLDDWLR